MEFIAGEKDNCMTKTVDISGMDELRSRYGYEWGCQVIMFRALHWLRNQGSNLDTPNFKMFSNITGIMLPSNSSAEDMEKFALDHTKLREFGATGAMVQYSLMHAMKRAELGEDAYFAEFKDLPDRVFEFDEQDAFEPTIVV